MGLCNTHDVQMPSVGIALWGLPPLPQPRLPGQEASRQCPVLAKGIRFSPVRHRDHGKGLARPVSSWGLHTALPLTEWALMPREAEHRLRAPQPARSQMGVTGPLVT